MQGATKFFFINACVCFAWCACGDDNASSTTSDSAKRNDSTGERMIVVDTMKSDTALVALSDPSRDTLPEILRRWEEDLQEKGINLRPDNFYASAVNPFYFNAEQEWTGTVSERFTLSPDSSYYAYDVPSWEDGDADTYLYLVDIKKRRTYILSVIGPCCTYAGTGWKDDHTLIAIGYSTEKAETQYPGRLLTQGFYQVFDLNTGYYTFYESKNFFKRPCGNCGPSSAE